MPFVKAQGSKSSSVSTRHDSTENPDDQSSNASASTTNSVGGGSQTSQQGPHEGAALETMLATLSRDAEYNPSEDLQALVDNENPLPSWMQNLQGNV
ncbi:uncharacterized protein I303_100537 [Kwoniella dejecticola CBS 10117]|uniref:Uncharacterized protein n=1 Tax=Kwoniella dejecticola CBS 10117 TaxID=1296121 RepID=A0A1A6AF86_9TREE|nr:uncharacterized protein I303_00538 [Kwoniella dejecticola CBS 10117]OBR88721.1 hypothetical protein I303_00538 [Kwoniella dejecticola CBS 10117]